MPDPGTLRGIEITTALDLETLGIPVAGPMVAVRMHRTMCRSSSVVTLRATTTTTTTAVILPVRSTTSTDIPSPTIPSRNPYARPSSWVAASRTRLSAAQRLSPTPSRSSRYRRRRRVPGVASTRTSSASTRRLITRYPEH